MKKENYYALAFVTGDKKGIVAAVTKVLFDNGFNLSDTSSTLLCGVFSMILIVTSERAYHCDEIVKMFESTGYVPTVLKYESSQVDAIDDETYSISVYGADKAGIVHAITSVLAADSVNITELQTKVTGKGGAPVYIMMLEAIAGTQTSPEWQEKLKDTASQIGTNINIRKIETYEF